MLKRHRPRALAGCIAALRRLADERMETGQSLPTLSHGILALTAVGYPTLADRDRALLWDAFQAPVYEQCRCWDGLLFAEECIAHAGLHLRVPTHVAGAPITYQPCACGDTSPRVIAAPALVQSPSLPELAIGA